MLKYFILLTCIFFASLLGGTVFGGNHWANYLSPLLMVVGLFFCYPKLRFVVPVNGMPTAVFYAWLVLSVVFAVMFYTDKKATLLNVSSIAAIYFATMVFLGDGRWKQFVDAFVFFLVCFVILNLMVQLLLPRSWGEFIFATQTGLSEKTRNFTYVTLVESLPFQPDKGPLSLPAFRNHGVAFLAGMISIGGLASAVCAAKNGATSIASWSMFMLGLVLCFLSESRAALVGMLLVILAAYKYLPQRALLALAAMVLALCLALFKWDEVVEKTASVFRVGDSISETASGRAGLWKLHALMIAERPWQGWGWRLPYEKFSYDSDTQPTTESGLTFTVASQGILRGALYVSLFGLAIWRLRQIRDPGYHEIFLQFACLFFFVGFLMVGAMVSVTSAIGSVSQVLLAIALFCAGSRARDDLASDDPCRIAASKYPPT